MRLRSVHHRDVWPYVGCVHCVTQDDGEFHVYSSKVIFTIDGNRAGMVLCMSCVHQDVSRDQFGVAGILMNDGRGCGSNKKFSVANG